MFLTVALEDGETSSSPSSLESSKMNFFFLGFVIFDMGVNGRASPASLLASTLEPSVGTVEDVWGRGVAALEDEQQSNVNQLKERNKRGEGESGERGGEDGRQGGKLRDAHCLTNTDDTLTKLMLP